MTRNVTVKYGPSPKCIGCMKNKLQPRDERSAFELLLDKTCSRKNSCTLQLQAAKKFYHEAQEGRNWSLAPIVWSAVRTIEVHRDLGLFESAD